MPRRSFLLAPAAAALSAEAKFWSTFTGWPYHPASLPEFGVLERPHALAGRLTFEGHTQPYPKDLILARYHRGGGNDFDCWDWRKTDALFLPKDGR